MDNRSVNSVSSIHLRHEIDDLSTEDTEEYIYSSHEEKIELILHDENVKAKTPRDDEGVEIDLTQFLSLISVKKTRKNNRTATLAGFNRIKFQRLFGRL